MDNQVDSLTPIHVMSKIIDAVSYNHVRLALLRITNPLRIELPNHRGLEIILHDKYWLCVDSLHNDQPIMAWCNFDTHKHNTGLHEPIPCELRFYHTHASLIMGSALDALKQILAEKLAYSHNAGN